MRFANKKNQLAFFLAALSGVCAQRSSAQLLSNNVFLQGSYIEVGIAPNGAFGSGVNAPAGYHPRTGSSKNTLGFVADPAKDGWTVGSPAYYGDYFMPGTPQEGWDIQIGSSHYKAWRATSDTSMTGGLTGSNVSYTASSGQVKGVWQGVIGDLSITQTTLMKLDKLYFVITVDLKNNGTTTLRNLYYERTVDPDNDVLTGGDYITRNAIISKVPSAGGKTLVRALGYVDTLAYLGMGTKDCRARPYILDDGLSPSALPGDIYNGTGAASHYKLNQGDELTADVGIGIVFDLDTLAPGASTSVSYAYILKPEDLDSAYADIAPQWSYNDNNYQSGDTIKVCAGKSINLSVINAGYYDGWTWTPTTGLSTSTSSQATVTVGSTPVTYTASGTSSICGTTITTSITILPQSVPASPAVSSPVNLCKGVTATALTATGTNLLWYTSATGGTGSATAPTPSTTAAGSVSYYVTQSSSYCESPRKEVTVNVNSSPIPSVATPVKLCYGTPAAPLSATGTNLLWYSSATGGTGSATAPTPNTSVVTTTTYYVTQSAPPSGCESDRVPVNVTVSNLPDARIGIYGIATAADSCFKAGSTLEAASIPAATSYKWYVNGNLQSGAVSGLLEADSSDYYSVVVTDINGCQDSATVFVYADALGKPVLSPTDLRICPGVAVMLYCSPAVSGYTYTWEKDNVAYTTGAGTSSVVTTTGIYLVRVTDPMGCVKLTNTTTLSTYPDSPKPSIQRFDALLQLDHSYTSYVWYRNDKLIVGATGRSYTLSFDGTYYAMVTDSYGCTSYSDTIVINALSIDNVSLNDELHIYPNPSSATVTISYKTPLNISITDVAGRSLMQVQQANTIDIGSLADGLYIISCTDANGVLLRRQTLTKAATR